MAAIDPSSLQWVGNINFCSLVYIKHIIDHRDWYRLRDSKSIFKSAI